MTRKQRALRILRRSAAALLVLVLVVAGFVTISTQHRMDRRYETRIETLTVIDSPEARARGEHLVRSLTNCVECHGDDLGGKIMLESPAIGTLAGPNLTPGGPAAMFSTEDWTRAIVRGVARDGHPLLIMPSGDYSALGREDLVAIIAFLRSVPAVDRNMPQTRLGPVGRLLMATGQLPALEAERIDHEAPLRDAPKPAVSAVFGEYLANGGGCRGCHSPSLAGGPVPGAPPGAKPSADLRPPALAKYTDTEIENILRTGRRPDGSMVDSMMPWRATAQMTELEIDALVVYLRKGPDTRQASN